MGNTLAIMFTMTTYGTWLRGDERGWIDDGKLMPPSPRLHAADELRMKYPTYYFPHDQLHDVGNAICEGLSRRLKQTLFALTVRRWHVHFIVSASPVPVPEIAKCAKDSVRYEINAGRPIWTADYDKRFCFDDESLMARIRYVERHNEEDGLPSRPWSQIKLPTFV